MASENYTRDQTNKTSPSSLSSAVTPSLSSAVTPSLSSAVKPTVSSAVTPSLSSAVTPSLSSAVTFSRIPDEIVVYHILPLFSIEEIGPFKEVCKQWLGLVHQYFLQLKVLDLTPWNFMVHEEMLCGIVKYAANLQELRLDRCWKAVTEDSILTTADSCHHLEVFCASRCGTLTDVSVKALVKKCTKLAELDLSSCYRVTDDSLCSIATYAKNLRELHVGSVYGVTDFGVSQLAFKCHTLKRLDVSYCFRVSNLGLEGFLSRASKKDEDLVLKYIRVKDCQKVTDAMVARLISVGVEVNNMF